MYIYILANVLNFQFKRKSVGGWNLKNTISIKYHNCTGCQQDKDMERKRVWLWLIKGEGRKEGRGGKKGGEERREGRKEGRGGKKGGEERREGRKEGRGGKKGGEERREGRKEGRGGKKEGEIGGNNQTIKTTII